jgi:glycine dehydrogenase subunit 1
MAAAPEYKVFVGAGSYDHHIPAAVHLSHLPLRVCDLLHPLPARDEPGHPAGRSSSTRPSRRGCWAWRWPTPPCTTGPRPWPRRCSWRCGSPAARGGGLAPGAPALPPGGRDLFDPTGFRGGRAAVRPARHHRPRQFDAAGTWPRWPCSRPTSSAASRTWKRSPKPPTPPAALCVAAFSEPLAYGLFKSPGSLGADIACGEGQSLGMPRSSAAPGLGIFATRLKHSCAHARAGWSARPPTSTAAAATC